MSFIGKNIKKIRTVKSLNQTDFGKMFNLTRGSIGSYEEGRAEPKIETLKEIAKKFSITLDGIITTELTVNQLSGFSPEDVVTFKASEKGAVGLPSILPKTLIEKNGDITILTKNTFFKTNLINKSDFSLSIDDSIKRDGVIAKKGDIIFCKKNITKSSFGYVLIRQNQIFWQSHQPQDGEGVSFTVTGVVSDCFTMDNKNPVQEKLSELELRIINLESKG